MPQFCRASHRVLVAEDNTTNSLVMKAIVERAGYRCTLVRDGEQALDSLVHEVFDIAALDVQMPRMDGLEAVKALRFMRPCFPQLPLILFSAGSGPGLQQECRRAGANAFVPKPIQAGSFLQTLAQLLEHYDQSRGLHEGGGAKAGPWQGNGRESQVLDRVTLAELEMISAEPAFLDGLLAGFMADNRLLLERLVHALALRSDAQALDLLHSLKGSALSIGAGVMQAACQQVHHGIVSGAANPALLMDAVMREFEHLCVAIEDYRHQRALSV